MKTISKTISILLMLFVTISCNDDDSSSSTTPTTPEGYFFKSKINNVQFNAVVPEFGASKSGNVITIACVQGIHKFQIKITNPIGNGVGTYTIPATTTGNVILTYEDDVATYASGNCGTTGTLTITSVANNQISGTFSFNGQKSGACPQPQKNITEGSFKAIYAGS